MYTDEELVRLVLDNKEVNFFEDLYDRHSLKVYNTCFKYLKNTNEAEDLTQDIFLKLYLNLYKFKGASKFSTWLHSFTRNHCLNYLKRHNSKKIQNKSVHYLDLENIGDTIGIEDERNRRIANLLVAMNLISNNDKKILSLKYLEEKSIKEISKLLMIGESAVKMRLKRAKSHLVEVMPVAV